MSYQCCYLLHYGACKINLNGMCELKRLGMLDEFLKEVSYAELKRKAENRKEWKTWKSRTCLTAEYKRRRRCARQVDSKNLFMFRVVPGVHPTGTKLQ